MKYYIIAGEASGDLHGSNLIREIRQRDSLAEIRCWGGELMAAAGATLVKHYAELAFMGFVEVIANLRTIFKNIDFCKNDLTDFNPDAIIFIDYPGFNLRVAKWAREKNYRTIYYISPQVWAWKENRVKAIRRDIDKMLVILPFEKLFYQKWNFPVEYVGHPLVEVIENFTRNNNNITPDHDTIALLPGSRKQEILKKLPVMLSLSKQFPAHKFVVAKAPGMADDFYTPLLAPYPNVSAVRNDTYALLMRSRAALVTSGTATLETALFGVPEVVCYKGSSISYQIAKRLIRVKFISLVNLIMDRQIIRELIQEELTTANLAIELKKILADGPERDRITRDYATLKAILKEGGNASAQAAESIWIFMQKKNKGLSV